MNNKILLQTIRDWSREVIDIMKTRQKQHRDTSYQSGYLQALSDIQQELLK